MKLKKNTIKSIIVILTTMIILFVNGKISAETFQPNGVDGTRLWTKATVVTKKGSSILIWQFPSNGLTTPNNNLFCANEGGRFIGGNEYTGYDIYDKDNMLNNVDGNYNTVKTNYNQVLWVLDNIYVSYDENGKIVRDELKSRMIDNLKFVTNYKFNTEIDNLAQSENCDSLFFTIGQSLLWKYTKNKNGDIDVIRINYNKKENADATTVLNALKAVADTKKDYESPNLKASEIESYMNSLSIDSSSATITDKSDSDKLVGPFVINNYDSKYKNIVTEDYYVKVNGEKLSTYGIDRDKENENVFYLKVNSSDLPSTCDIEIEYVPSIIITTGKYWIQSKGGQQLVSANKKLVKKSIATSVSQSSKYYLSVLKMKYGTSNIVEGADVSIFENDTNGTPIKAGTTGTDWSSLRTDEFEDTKTFIIRENNAPNGYINMLEGLDIKVTISKSGNAFTSTRKIFRGNTDVTSEYGKYVSFNKAKESDDVLRIGLYIKDPNSIDYKLKIIKKDKKTQDELSGAKFSE